MTGPNRDCHDVHVRIAALDNARQGDDGAGIHQETLLRLHVCIYPHGSVSVAGFKGEIYM